MGLIETVYIYVDNSEYNELKKLFQKYDVGCTNSKYPCIKKCTFKKDFLDYEKGEIFLEFKMSRDRNKLYTLGEEVFQLIDFERITMNQLIEDGDKKVLEIMTGSTQKYKAFEYIRYKMFEQLPFTDEEYEFIKSIEEVDSSTFLEELYKEGVQFKDILESEKVAFEPSEPEKKYMDKINTLFDLLDNEIEERSKMTSGETYVVIDLDLIKKELKDIAKDNNIKISITKKGLSVDGEYWVLKYDETNEEGNKIYLYDESKTLKIQLARNLRKKETNSFY